MKRIALTGGIACGKSLVAKYLNELGVETIDADDVVHELIPDPAERKRIAAEVFADPEKRKALEAKLHPIVKERIRSWSEELEFEKGVFSHHSPTPAHNSNSTPTPTHNSNSIRIAIIPLLFETHWDADYDIICAVISPRETQVERMMTTRGYTREEAEARLGAQLPVTEKAAKSHYVINNNGTPEELRKETEELVTWLKNSTYSQACRNPLQHLVPMHSKGDATFLSR